MLHHFSFAHEVIVLDHCCARRIEELSRRIKNVKFQDLIDAAHAKGMKIVLDVVLQHTGNFGETKLNPLFTRNQNIRNQANIEACMIPDNERLGGALDCNERLEFLGDAVLGMVVGDHLYREHHDLPEGDLTRLRASMVCEEALAEVAKDWHLGDYIRLGHGEALNGGHPPDRPPALEQEMAATSIPTMSPLSSKPPPTMC